MNVEREVPLEEIEESSEETRRAWSVERLSALMEEGLAVLAADNGTDADTRPTTADTNMRWEQGRYVADDGSVFISANECVAGSGYQSQDPPPMLLGTQVPKDEAPKDSHASLPSACGTGLRGIRCLRKNRPQAPPAA